MNVVNRLSLGYISRLYTLNASVLGTHDESRWAEFADCFVIFHVTGSIIRTTKIFARILALIIDAGHVDWASTIPQADGNASLTIIQANADCLVIQDLTGLSGWWGARISRSCTGTHAATGNTGRITGTFVVHSAFDRAGTTAHLARLADDEAVLTDANRPVATDFTPLSLVTLDILEFTRISASSHLSIARVIGGTLRVPQTDGRRFLCGRWRCGNDAHRRSLSGGSSALRIRWALDRSSADVALRAGAAGFVDHDLAQSVHSASTADWARILTLLVDARFVCGAVGIERAGLIYTTIHVSRISFGGSRLITHEKKDWKWQKTIRIEFYIILNYTCNIIYQCDNIQLKYIVLKRQSTFFSPNP